MEMTLDGQIVAILPSDRNIVDVADRLKKEMIAACYRARRKNGCCHGCIIDVEGKLRFACATAPQAGMNVIVDRADLIKIRKERALLYREKNQDGKSCGGCCQGPGPCGGSEGQDEETAGP
jgi:predicted molibdopterin-dependent oxidoreductase YjgC